MLEQFGDAVSNYFSFKEVIPAPRFGELPERPRGRKPYARFLPTLGGAFLFVEGLSLWESRKAFAVALIATAAVIGIVVPLIAIVWELKKSAESTDENACTEEGR